MQCIILPTPQVMPSNRECKRKPGVRFNNIDSAICITLLGGTTSENTVQQDCMHWRYNV